jgi:hypothetical protein
VHLALQIEEVGGRNTARRVLRSGAVDPIQLFGLGIGERLEQDRIENAEHSCVRADAETKRDNREESETGRPDQLPEGET